MDYRKKIVLSKNMLLGEFVIVPVVVAYLCIDIDHEFALHILSDKSNIQAILRLLSSTNENTVISTLTTLYYLCACPEGIQSILWDYW